MVTIFVVVVVVLKIPNPYYNFMKKSASDPMISSYLLSYSCGCTGRLPSLGFRKLPFSSFKYLLPIPWGSVRGFFPDFST